MDTLSQVKKYFYAKGFFISLYISNKAIALKAPMGCEFGSDFVTRYDILLNSKGRKFSIGIHPYEPDTIIIATIK